MSTTWKTPSEQMSKSVLMSNTDTFIFPLLHLTKYLNMKAKRKEEDGAQLWCETYAPRHLVRKYGVRQNRRQHWSGPKNKQRTCSTLFRNNFLFRPSLRSEQQQPPREPPLLMKQKPTTLIFSCGLPTVWSFASLPATVVLKT